MGISAELKTSFRATTPTTLIGFLYVKAKDAFKVTFNASSQIYFVVKGKGYTESGFGKQEWKKNDLISYPANEQLTHVAEEDSIFYLINDEPLLSYLGVTPQKRIFAPTYYPYEVLVKEIDKIRSEPDALKRNRTGILIANPACSLTHTITPTLWALYNVITPGQVQPPHCHNSVALDFVISAKKEGVYILMAKEIDEAGRLIKPIRADWQVGCTFITQPGVWHFHHNESDEDAFIMPMQDAGLHVQMRTLNIRFRGRA
jgi:gentisate 1,2-dioxygenase